MIILYLFCYHILGKKMTEDLYFYFHGPRRIVLKKAILKELHPRAFSAPGFDLDEILDLELKL